LREPVTSSHISREARVRDIPIVNPWAGLALGLHRAATSTAATIMGLGNSVGSVSAGHLADIVIVDGGPLVNVGVLRDPVWVLKGGKIVREP